MGEEGGEDEWMCGRQQEEKQGRKAELFYLEPVLSGRPLDQIYTSDLWGFHLVLERETERGNAEEGEASRAGDGTLSRTSEWHGERPECRSVNTAPSSSGKRKSRPALNASCIHLGELRGSTGRRGFQSESLHIRLDELRRSDSQPAGQSVTGAVGIVQGKKGAGLQPGFMDVS